MAIEKSMLEAMEVAATGNKFTVTNADKVYRDTLPEGLTPELMEKAAEHNAKYDAAIYEACLPKMVEAMKADKNLGLVEMEANAMSRTYGITIVRPEQENPTDEQLEDSITLFVVEKHSESLGGCLSRAVALWKN